LNRTIVTGAMLDFYTDKTKDKKSVIPQNAFLACKTRSIDNSNESKIDADHNAEKYEHDKQCFQLKKGGSRREFLKGWVCGMPASVSPPFNRNDFSPCDRDSEIDLLNQMKDSIRRWNAKYPEWAERCANPGGADLMSLIESEIQQAREKRNSRSAEDSRW
ncbi:MAG: hypothetical protein AAF709_08800, partial [Pseudomonadota bacterium]